METQAPLPEPGADGDVDGDVDGATSAVAAGMTQLVRWVGRGDVRRALAGPAGQDLSPTDTWLLAVIHDGGPVRASVLATMQGVDKSTITLQVRRLEERGLVARQSDPTDRRAALLAITPLGGQVHRRIRAASTAVVARALEGWPEADRAALADLLPRFAADLPKYIRQ